MIENQWIATHLKWEREVKVGDAVCVKWTNSHHHLGGIGQIVRINDKSFSVELTEDVKSGGVLSWKKGQKINTPKSTTAGRFSLSNGVFPIRFFGAGRLVVGMYEPDVDEYEATAQSDSYEPAQQPTSAAPTENKGKRWTIWNNRNGNWQSSTYRFNEEAAIKDAKKYQRRWQDTDYRVTAPDGKLVWTSEQQPAPDAPTGDAAPATREDEPITWAELARRNAEAHIANAHQETLDKLAAAEAERDALAEQVRELRAALEPFALAVTEVPFGVRSTLRVWIGDNNYKSLSATTDHLEQAAKVWRAASARE